MKTTKQAVAFIPNNESRSARRQRHQLQDQAVAGQQVPLWKRRGLLAGDEEGPRSANHQQPFGPHSLRGPHRLHPPPTAPRP